jgi:hypothetical protein
LRAYGALLGRAARGEFKMRARHPRSQQLLRQEVADEAAVVFVFDACEYFSAELPDRFRAIEGEAFVHLSTAKVAGHAFRLEDGLDLTFEIDPWNCC